MGADLCQPYVDWGKVEEDRRQQERQQEQGGLTRAAGLILGAGAASAALGCEDRGGSEHGRPDGEKK